jgi:membrane protease YdiL (CAAX protease family)
LRGFEDNIMDHNKFAKVKSSPWLYFALTLGWSWLFWIPLAISGIHISKAPGIICFVVGIFGPSFSAIVLTYFLGDEYERRDFWERAVSLTRITPRWYAIILLIAPLCSLLAIITDLMLHGALPYFDTAIRYINNPITIIPFALTTLIYGPLPEELGWRGYALDRLQRNHGALVSSIILGVIWSIWHIPMFFINGSIMSDVFPLWSARFWVAMGPGILATSVIMTWIYNNTQHSILAAIILHFMMNFTAEFLRLPGDYKNYAFIWIIVIAILIVIYSEPTKFESRKKYRPVEN